MTVTPFPEPGARGYNWAGQLTEAIETRDQIIKELAEGRATKEDLDAIDEVLRLGRLSEDALKSTIATEVNPLVAQAIADDDTVVQAAAAAAGPAVDQAITDQGGIADPVIAAAFAEDTSAARTETDKHYAGASFFKRRPGAGTATGGDVIELSPYAHHLRPDTGTSIVAGGAPGYENVVGGNLANVDTPTPNTDDPPTLTGQNGNWNFLLAGYDTVVNGWACVVSGFHNKVAAGQTSHVTIAGGSHIDVQEGGDYSTVGGGTRHTVTGANATISGGRDHVAGASAAVGGGSENEALGNTSTISGGYGNKALTSNTTVGGGTSNTASANGATVVGGQSNTASGTGSSVIGGRDGQALADYSVATGRGGKAIDRGQHAHATDFFTTPGDAQVSVWSARTQTTDGSLGELMVGGLRITVEENQTLAFTATVTGRSTAGESKAFTVRGCITRDAGDTCRLVGTPLVETVAEDAGAATWTVAVAALSGGSLRLRPTGEAGKTIRWVARVEGAQVTT